MAMTETVKRSANLNPLPRPFHKFLHCLQRPSVSDMKQQYRQTVPPTDIDNDLTIHYSDLDYCGPADNSVSVSATSVVNLRHVHVNIMLLCQSSGSYTRSNIT